MTPHLRIVAYTLVLLFGLSLNLSAQRVEESELIVEFDKLLSLQFKDGQPSAAALVARRGQIICKKAIGLAKMKLLV